MKEIGGPTFPLGGGNVGPYSAKDENTSVTAIRDQQ